MTSTPLLGLPTTLKHEDDHPGSGHIHITSSHSRARFSTSLASYPLKILSPSPLPSQPSNVAVGYTLAYGGGLVAGDVISLRVEIDEGCGLVLLTQGSTKVFKHRPGIRPRSQILRSTGQGGSSVSALTRQRLHVTLRPNSFLLLLPDSISPFRDSQYSQVQRFVLSPCGTASVAILDWVNSGRGQRSLPGIAEELEIWAMKSYASTNEVMLADRLVMKERMILDNAIDATDIKTFRAGGLSRTARQLAPYNVYATLLLLGPHVKPILAHLTDLVDQTSQFQLSQPLAVIWSFSPLENGNGGIVRVAGVEVEDVRGWLRGIMSAGGVADLVGDGLWPRII